MIFLVTLFLPILSLCLFRYPSEKTAAGKNHIYKGSVGHPRKLIHQDKISRYIHEGRSCLENKPTRVTCSGKSNGIILFSYSMNHDAERNSPHLIFNDRQMSSHFFLFFSSSHGSAPEPLSLLLYMNIHIRTALWPGSIDSDHPSFSLSKRTPITVSVESESLSGTFKYFNGNAKKCNQFTQYIGVMH